mmetsp:Transcript_12229/g.18242  ORF Transcript_12229/g.18242 Transcript_12229/m.18242 type:complete len:271 (+) Transcript_12229:64-876(+)|eukprot:CAMPEP_0167753638 /NCGR_PEP_ID=MMETSP0110_2-20121227/7827_1 /TAXON_ID=629695 /ORGANISM="Gymnochlora sp., Strain CCMP2014" /LENGTH=270 /DNA_ID=CAMNT_0007639431 /DNA_START=47 /DNA_END=859 /DNA_ORIENTATION=-
MTEGDITKDFKDLSKKRENLVFMARAAESAERYSDMCQIMKLLVEWKEGSDPQPLDIEERNLLSVAYKNVIGTRRASHRCLSVEDYKGNTLIGEYKKLIEEELNNICEEILGLLTNTLVPGVVKALKAKESDAKLNEALVFYLKMTGDYYRYLAEIIHSNADFKSQAKKTYSDALKIAEEHLLPTHPIRLGLALNFSVCHYEILHDQTAACDLAKRAFDAAIAKLDSIDEGSYKDSTLIMQLLRDNLTLWTSPENMKKDDDEEEPQADAE